MFNFSTPKTDTLKAWYSLLTFICAIGFGVAGMFIPPPGVVDSSVLILIAQLLVFVSSLLGMNLSFEIFGKKITNISTDKKKEEDK